MTTHQRLELSIQGIVQGVCYRAYAQDEARRLGLQGFVRNRADGSVELVAEGPREALEQLERWCHRGPPSAQVFQIVRTVSPAQGEFTGFEIRR